jgi:predicted acylesterase/phospholipase RssA
LLEINRQGWIKMDPLKDKTLPIVALLAGKKLDRMLTMMFGNARIEDLGIKFFCVSANLTQAVTVIHESGSLKAAVRASMAIPGVAPPICDNGDLIVDGGVLNNLPGDVMRTISGGMVIAVDVSPQKDLAVDPDYREMPSSWRVLWSRINPLADRVDVPNVLAVMMRTLMLNSVHNSRQVMKHVDLYIRPPVEPFGIFDWHQLDKIVDAGYQFARKKLAEWKAGQGAEPLAGAGPGHPPA